MTCLDSKPLLELRRQISANKEFSPKVMLSLIDCIDLIRHSHDPSDTECCQCWTKAIADAERAA